MLLQYRCLLNGPGSDGFHFGCSRKRALLLGFGIPFLVLVGVLVMVLLMTDNEGLSALCGLAALVPYYGILYLCRDRISRQLMFYLE